MDRLFKPWSLVGAFINESELSRLHARHFIISSKSPFPLAKTTLRSKTRLHAAIIKFMSRIRELIHVSHSC